MSGETTVDKEAVLFKMAEIIRKAHQERDERFWRSEEIAAEAFWDLVYELSNVFPDLCK